MDTKWIIFWALFIPVLLYKPLKKHISSRIEFEHKQKVIRNSKGLNKVSLIIREDATTFFAMTNSKDNAPLFWIIEAYATFVDYFYSAILAIYNESNAGMSPALERYFNNFGEKLYEHKFDEYRYKYSARIYGLVFGLLLVKISGIKHYKINKKKAISFLSDKAYTGQKSNEYAAQSFNRCLLYISEISSPHNPEELSKYELKLALSFLGLSSKSLNKYRNLESTIRTAFAIATNKALNKISTSSVNDLLKKKLLRK